MINRMYFTEDFVISLKQSVDYQFDEQTIISLRWNFEWMFIRWCLKPMYVNQLESELITAMLEIDRADYSPN